MPTGWDSILTVISFDDCYTDGLEMLLYVSLDSIFSIRFKTVHFYTLLPIYFFLYT